MKDLFKRIAINMMMVIIIVSLFVFTFFLPLILTVMFNNYYCGLLYLVTLPTTAAILDKATD